MLRWINCSKLSCQVLVVPIILLCSYNGTIVSMQKTPSIRSPGPDDASFPSTPFTVPKGVTYIESFPLWLDVPDETFPCQYAWPSLLRLGLLDTIEFRIQSQGFTHISSYTDRPSINGLGPIAIGFKFHLWGTENWRYLPSAGLEAYIVTPIASRELRDGIQYIINSAFDIRLSDSLRIEWNIAGYSRSNPCGKKHTFYTFIEWALEKEIHENLELFIQGTYSSAVLPYFDKTALVGAGFLSYLSERVAIFGTYNWSVFHTTNSEFASAGFAVAF